MEVHFIFSRMSKHVNIDTAEREYYNRDGIDMIMCVIRINIALTRWLPIVNSLKFADRPTATI